MALPVAFALVGVLVAVAAAGWVQHETHNGTVLEFERLATQVSLSLQREIELHEQGLVALAGLYASSEQVTRHEFALFTGTMLDYCGGVQAYEWSPRVPAARRAEVEQAVRDEGYPGFRFTDVDADGQLVDAPARDESYPVLYVEPLAGNERAFGYDPMLPVRQDVIARARDSGRAALSDRLTLVQETGVQFGLLEFIPIYEGGQVPSDLHARRARLAGLVEAVYRVDDLFAEGFGDARERGIVADVYYDDGDPRPLWHSAGHPDGLPATNVVGAGDVDVHRDLAARGLAHALPLRFADRELHLIVHPGPHFSPAGATLFPLLALALGLSITAAITASLLLYRRRTVRVEALVEARTAALRASQAQLLQAQKIESVGRLAGGVAHDFNNLLTAILGGAQVAAMDLPAEHPVQPELRQIEHTARRAAALTRQLLAFSRRQLLQPQAVDLHRLIHELRRMLQRMIDERVELRLLLHDEPLWVHADPSQIEQVLVNLVVNARDAMPDGGPLTIGTAPAPPLDGRPAVALWVADAGVGMDESTCALVFEPFFTTKQQGKGTGLGLSTVWGIVHQSGGEIAVHSVLGEGTRFDLRLPAALPDESTPRPAPTVPLEGSLGDRGVLVVEDDRSVRQSTTDILHRAGYRVWSAGDGEEGLALFERLGTQVDVVLTDVVMPRRDGRALATELRRRRPELPIVMMSGYTHRADILDLVGELRLEVLGKPFERTALLAALARALA